MPAVEAILVSAIEAIFVTAIEAIVVSAIEAIMAIMAIMVTVQRFCALNGLSHVQAVAYFSCPSLPVFMSTFPAGSLGTSSMSQTPSA